MKNETKTMVDFNYVSLKLLFLFLHYFSGRNNVTNTKTIAFFFFNPFDLLILSAWLPPFAFFSSVYTSLSSVTSFILRLKPKRLLAVDGGSAAASRLAFLSAQHCEPCLFFLTSSSSC